MVKMMREIGMLNLDGKELMFSLNRRPKQGVCCEWN